MPVAHRRCCARVDRLHAWSIDSAPGCSDSRDALARAGFQISWLLEDALVAFPSRGICELLSHKRRIVQFLGKRTGAFQRSLDARGLVFRPSVVISLAARFSLRGSTDPMLLDAVSTKLPNRSRRSQRRLTNPRARAGYTADAQVAVFPFLPAKVLASVR